MSVEYSLIQLIIDLNKLGLDSDSLADTYATKGEVQAASQGVAGYVATYAILTSVAPADRDIGVWRVENDESGNNPKGLDKGSEYANDGNSYNFIGPFPFEADDLDTDTSSFDGILSAADDQVQKALDTIDDNAVGTSTFNSHKNRHDPQDGADALDTAAPSEIANVQASGVGSSHSLARADHQHQIQHGITNNHIVTVDGTPSDNEYAKWTANGLEGRSRAEVTQDLVDDATSNPADTGTSANDGSEDSFARKDHVHKLHDHDHSGDAGDGGQLDSDNINEGSTNKFVSSDEANALDNAPNALNAANPVADKQYVDTQLATQNQASEISTDDSGESVQDKLDTLSVVKKEFFINGNQSAITAGLKGYIRNLPAGTITKVSLLADQSSTTSIDLWKCTYSDYDAGVTHPVDGDSITAGNEISLTASTKNEDSTLIGWTTTIALGDILAVYVDSNDNAEKLTLTLTIERD